MKSQVRRWDDLRWQELTWTQFKWDELRRNENSWNETRRGEKSWDAWRKKLAQWGMLNKNEKKWEKMRTDEKELRCGAEMKRTVSEMKTADKRREQLRWTEKKWENMRWGHMKFVFNCTCIDAAVKASYVTSWRGSVGGTTVTVLAGERIRRYGGDVFCCRLLHPNLFQETSDTLLMLRDKNIPVIFNQFFLLPWKCCQKYSSMFFMLTSWFSQLISNTWC